MILLVTETSIIIIHIYNNTDCYTVYPEQTIRGQVCIWTTGKMALIMGTIFYAFHNKTL